MSETSTWIKVTREDGEIVGYIEPVTGDYGVVQPRTVLGHSIGDPCEYVEGEDLLIEHGIVLADYLEAKALVVDKKITIEWPDLHQRLSLSRTQ